MITSTLYRREALSKWKSGLGSRATYKALIEVFIKAGKADYADAVRDVLREGVDPSPNPDPTVATGKGGASGGSQVAAATPESQAQTTSTSTGMDTTEKHCVHCTCLLYTSPSPRDATLSRMPSSA